MDDIKISSNRSFGIVFFIVFLLIAIFPVTNGEEIRLWSIIVSLIFLVLGYFNSKIGVTQALNYRPIPGTFKGCIPLSESGGKLWS